MKTLILIDANALIHRSFHALPPLTAPSGEIVNAVYGFTMVLLKMLKDLKPDYVVAAFDLPEPTFRHEEYREYKATRKKAPDELYAQIPKVKEILGAFGIPIYEKAGFEADDIIGTIIEKVKIQNSKVKSIIVTGDTDTLQLVGKNTAVYGMRKGISDTVIYDEKAVEEKFEGLKPTQLNDYKGLKGDPSDNIPGVPGVGEKIALELIKRFGSIEGLYRALEKGESLEFMRGGKKLAETILKNKEQALFSKKLVTLRLDAPIEFDLEKSRQTQLDIGKIGRIFRELGFYSLIGRLSTKRTDDFDGQVKPVEADKEGGFKIEEIENQKEAEKAIKFLKDQKEIGVNLSVPGNDWRKFQLQNIFIWANGRIFCFSSIPASLKSILEDGKIKKFGYNLKFVSEVLARKGIKIDGLDFDILIAAYLLNPGERGYPLGKIVFRELGEEMPVYSDDKESAAAILGWSFKVILSLKRKMKEAGLEKVFYEIEMPLIPVLVAMERAGVKIDKSQFSKLGIELEKRIAALEEEIYKMAGVNFNINSPRQLGDILFNKLKIGTQKIRKTPGGEISTRASELLKLRHLHPLVDLVLEFRELVKLKNTYIDVLPTLADSETGRIYAVFNQVGTATGRLSSDSPNLQNIPARGEWGKEIRKAFIADAGYSLVSCDYSQIELRIASHLAQDEKMMKIFHEGGDIHSATAAEINNVSLDKVTAEMRRNAKTLNFGVLYGMSAQAFSETAGISLEQAKKFINEYFHDFKGVKDYIERTKRFAYENGYVETLTGRRRYLAEINSPNFQLRAEAERMAVNMPVQGLAADIIKMAMIGIAKYFRRELDSDDLKMILQVHDELVFEMKDDIIESTASRLKEIMENIFKLAVPLVVDIKIGKNWGQMENLNLES